jgi:hypothetical protein
MLLDNWSQASHVDLLFYRAAVAALQSSLLPLNQAWA